MYGKNGIPQPLAEGYRPQPRGPIGNDCQKSWLALSDLTGTKTPGKQYTYRRKL